MSDQPLPEALSVSRGVGGLRLFGCFASVVGFFVATMFLLVGGAMFYLTAIRPITAIIAARSWQAVPCTFLPADHAGPAFRYEYVVQGAKFVGERYSFAEMEGVGPDAAELAQQYPPGSVGVCYVNPMRPADSVLLKGFVPELFWGLFPLPFLLVGFIGHVVLIVMWRRRTFSRLAESFSNDPHSAGSTTPAGFGPTTTPARVVNVRGLSNSDYDDEDLREEPGPVTLVPESTPLGNFIGAMVFAVIWNGVVGVFIAFQLGDWMQGRWDWFPDVLLIPFFLIGLGIIGLAIYCFLALFNPVSTLTLSRRLIPLGGTASAEWAFQGNPSSIRHVKLVLKGIEEARYTRGTDTVTDTKTFLEETVFETDDPARIAQGSAEISIPSDTMHSFNGTNNKIKWSIILDGDIPFWPNAGSTFPIQVVPHE